jgi:hypothetical protein
MKKIFIISCILLGTALLFLVIYNVAFRSNPYDPRAGREEGVEIENLPREDSSDVRTDIASPEEAAIEAVTQEKAVMPTFRASAGSILYFSSADAALKEVSVPGFAVRKVMDLAGAPLQAVWSPDSGRALVEMAAGGETRWHMLDVAAGSDVPLKPGIESPAWSNLGDKIVYKYYDAKTQERTLNVANPDGTDWRVLADVPFKRMRTAPLPKSSLIAFWNEGDAFEETSLRLLPITGGEATTAFSGQFGGDYRFSPDGQRIAASLSNKKGGSGLMLALLNNKGGELQNLFVPTLASKVAWSADGETLYYALPGALPEGSVLPNDYYLKPLSTQDTFWKMDMETGKKERVVDLSSLGQGYDAARLFLDPEDDYLFFVNRTDGKLYRIRL